MKASRDEHHTEIHLTLTENNVERIEDKDTLGKGNGPQEKAGN